ncbi:MAG: LysR family transcriptional regulator [Betaproteobacteria bacterium]
MNLQQLRYFSAIVEERSFTAAARKLALSQPALSRQIAALESALGAKLLERTPGGVQPTPAGRAVLPEARAALASAQRVAQAAKEVRGMEAGALKIATFPSLATGTLLPAIRRWHQRHPKVMLRLSEFRQRRPLQEAVRIGEVDLAIGTTPMDWSGPQRVVGWNEVVVVLPSRDPLLARAQSVALERLAERDWVLYEQAYGLSDVVAAACLRAGFRPRGAIETSQPEAAARLAAAGLGPALVPAANVPRELAGLSRRLAPRFVWEITAYTRAAWADLALAFLDMVAQYSEPEAPSGAVRWEVPRA